MHLQRLHRTYEIHLHPDSQYGVAIGTDKNNTFVGCLQVSNWVCSSVWQNARCVLSSGKT